MSRSSAPIQTTTISTGAVLNIGRFCCRLLLRTMFAGVFACGALQTVCLAQLPASQQTEGSLQSRAHSSFEAPRPKPARTVLLPSQTADHRPAAVRPVHIYPPGVVREDEPEIIQQTAMQHVLLPPSTGEVRVFGSPSTVGAPPVSGHTIFAPTPNYAAPNAETRPPIVLPPVQHVTPLQDSAGAETQEDTTLSWWEDDLPQSIIRDRCPVSMSLQQALGLALTEAPELQILHSDWYIQQTEVDRLDAAFDWTTFVDSVWNRDSTPVSSRLDGVTDRLRSRTLNATAGVRRLNIDGSEFELSQSAGLRNSNSVNISPNNQGNTRLSLEYEKPLLRGGGEDYNTSPQKLAVIEKDAAFDRFQSGVQDHLMEVATAYWTLVLRRGRFLQTVHSWKRASVVAAEMASRTEIDVTSDMLDRSRSEVATRLAASIEAEHDVLRAQDRLLRLVYGARFTEFANNEIVTLTLPMRQAEPLAPGPQIERALQNRSEVHQMIRQIKAASIRYNVAANEVLPQLNLVLTSYVAGLRGDNDVGAAFLSQFSEGEPGVGIGFNFEIPYRNRAAQALAEQTHIGMNRARAQLQLTMSEVTQDVRDQVFQRNKYGSVLQQRWEALARARRILKYTETRRKFLADGTQVADLYLEDLLNRQSRLAASEGIYLEAQVRYALADNGLLRAVSELESIADQSGGAVCQECLADAEAGDAEPATSQSKTAATSGHSLNVQPVRTATEPETAASLQNPLPVRRAEPVSFGHAGAN